MHAYYECVPTLRIVSPRIQCLHVEYYLEMCVWLAGWLQVFPSHRITQLYMSRGYVLYIQHSTAHINMVKW